jgi:hypothetical protein
VRKLMRVMTRMMTVSEILHLFRLVLKEPLSPFSPTIFTTIHQLIVATQDLLAQIFGASGTEDQQHVKQSLGIYWTDLTVWGKGAGETYFKTVGSLLDVVLHPGRVFGKRAKEARSGRRALIEGFSGVVKPGEMCLVLGRPGECGRRSGMAGWVADCLYLFLWQAPDARPCSKSWRVMTPVSRKSREKSSLGISRWM